MIKGQRDVSQPSQSQPDIFPVTVLPDRVRGLVLEAAEALGVDYSLIAGPCLAALAGCIGNRRRIVIKAGTWCEACVLWIAIVMRSGGGKTPAIGLVLEYLQELEAAEIEAETARQAEYERQEREHQRRKTQPERPEPVRRLLVSDITTEGLLSIHARAPLGLLLHRDELAGWFRGFNQYKGGKGSDAQTWTEMHQGKSCIIDRKVSGTLSVPRAAVSIVGGVQPEILRGMFGEHLYDGLAARVLFVVPPQIPKRWSEQTISTKTREEWASLLHDLLALEPNENGTPVDLPMTEAAKEQWVSFYDDHAEREDKEDGPMRSAMSKLEAAAARLALVVQLARDPQSSEIDVEALRAGITISEWFEGQARQVYQGLEVTEQERDRREVYKWIADHGGETTRRDLSRLGPGRVRSRSQEVLDDLVAAGLVKPSPQSGGPAKKYVLCDCDSCDGETE